jgi:hypothetical protein
VTLSTCERVHGAAQVPPEDRDDRVVLQPSCVLFNGVPRGEVLLDHPERARAAVMQGFEEALARALDEPHGAEEVQRCKSCES